MFSRRSKGRSNSGEPFTYIQEGTVLRGDIEAAGRVRVHGTILGNVRVVGVLEVAAEGTVQGERIEAEHVRILGNVEGLVSAAGKVEIWRGGRLEGDVRAASLDIEEGASFTGRSEMRPAGVPAALPGAGLSGTEGEPESESELEAGDEEASEESTTNPIESQA